MIRVVLCIVFCCIHLLAMAISTYIASTEIETILVSGPICSLTGIVAGIAALFLRRPILAIACFAAPILAVTLFIAEAMFLKLGPGRAAQPFMIIFLINQMLSLPIILLQLRQVINRARDERQQISLKTLMVTTAIFAAVFALLRLLQGRSDHSLMMYLALILLGLTVGAEALFVYYAVRYRRRLSTAAENDDLAPNDNGSAFDSLN